MVAPAGYGKSVWLEQFLAALESNDPHAIVRLAGPQHCTVELVESLKARDVATTLVVDNVHEAQSAMVYKLVAALLSGALHAVPHLRLCIASRRPLQLELAQHYARGDAVQITGDDLRFTTAELSQLFCDHLADEGIARVAQLTAGWPVAAQLIRMWLARQREPAAPLSEIPLDATHIGEFIEQQVLVDLTDRQKAFLLSVCVLDQIDAGIADCLRSDGHSAQILHELEPLRPLIYAPDAATPARKLNPLLKRHLEKALDAQGPTTTRRHHQQAATCLIERGDVFGAVMHACKAHEFDYAARLFLGAGGVRYFIKAGVHSFRMILDLLPEATVYSHPRLHLARVILLMKDGCFTLARDQLDHIRIRTREFTDDWTGEDPAPLQTDAAMTQTLFRYYCSSLDPKMLPTLTQTVLSDPSSDPYLMAVYIANVSLVIEQHCGNLQTAERLANTILRLCKRSRLDFQEAYTHLHLGLIAFARGRLSAALSAYERSLQILRERLPDEHELRFSNQMLIAETSFERAADQAVALRLHQALEMVEQTEGAFETYAGGFATAAAQAFSGAGIAAALDILQRAENKARERGIENLKSFVDACRITWLLRAGLQSQARQIAEDIGLTRQWSTLMDNAGSSWRVKDAFGLAAVRYLLQLGECQEAGRIAELAARDMLAGGRMGSLIRMRLLQCLIALDEGRAEDAQRIVQDALRMAAPLEYIRPFIDDGMALSDLFEHLEVAKAEAPFVNRLRTLLRSELVRQQGLGVLNGREVEVLQGLHAGHSNKEIARELGLSANTIKYHLRMIFAKLDVRRRDEALLEAQRRGLLTQPRSDVRH